MPRTTSDAVAAIIEVDASIPLAPFIETASSLVEEICAPADIGYTSERLELIERWLSAHFYAIRDPRTTNEKAGPVAATYESKVALHLDLTRYGQQAMLLDTNGGLAELNEEMQKPTKTRQAGVSWLGSCPPKRC